MLLKLASQMYWLAAEICRYAIPITTNKDAPCIYSKDTRICHRIPRNRLHKSAGDAKRTSGQNSKDCTRYSCQYHLCPSVSTCLPLNASSTFVKATVRLPRHSDSTIPATKSNTLDTATAAIFFFFMFCLLTVLLPLPLKADPDTHQ